MRTRMLSLILVLLLFAGGCHPPQESQNEPPHTTTVTAPDVNHTNGTIDTIDTTTGTMHKTPNISSSMASTSAGLSTDTMENVSTSAIIIDTTSSQTEGSTLDSSTSTAPSATTTHAHNNTVTFKATVRENVNKQPIKGVTVTVYTDANTSPAGSGVTDRSGVAHISIPKGSSYRVVLSNLPTGYEANSQYLFSTNTVNITINKAPVYNEADHSGAQYAVGKVMTDFSLTDTDGNTYRLSDLLKEKQLVILDFWYVSCEPCKGEFPFFESAVKKYGDKLALLAINPFDNNNAINNLRKQLNANSKTSISFPMMQDACNLSAGFGVAAFPTTVFINSDGVILDIHDNAYPTEAALFAAIERYLH